MMILVRTKQHNKSAAAAKCCDVLLATIYTLCCSSERHTVGQSVRLYVRTTLIELSLSFGTFPESEFPVKW
jgi:hypothetical protein